MILTYSPEGEEPQKWNFTFGKMRSSEADLVEKLAGAPLVQVQEQATSGPGKALRALIFVHLRKTHPSLKWDDFDPFVGEMAIDFDRDEMVKVRERLLQDPTVTDVQREMLDAAVEAAEEAPPKAGASSAA